MVPVEGWDGEVKFIPDFYHPKTKERSTWEVRWLLGKVEFGGDDFPWGRVGGEIPHTKQGP